jgi:cell division protein FtsB
MWFEEKTMKKTRIPEEYVLFRIAWQHRHSIQHLEREYLDLRVQLRDAEADLRSDAQNQELTARVDYLKSRIKDFENKYTWISTGRAAEIPFWVMPAG